MRLANLSRLLGVSMYEIKGNNIADAFLNSLVCTETDAYGWTSDRAGI